MGLWYGARRFGGDWLGGTARSSRLIGVLSAAIVALVVAWSPAGAQATVTWGATQTLSPTGVTASSSQVVTDAAGDALAVWVQDNPTAQLTGGGTGDLKQLEVAYRPAGGFFGSATVLSDGSGNASEPSLAMNASGQAVVVYDEQGTGVNETVYDLSSGGGSFQGGGSVNVVHTASSDPQVGIDSAGDVMLAYITGGAIYAAFHPAGSGVDFGPVQALSSAVPNGDVGGAAAINLAMNGAGDALLTWDETPAYPSNSGASDDQRVTTAFRPAGGLSGSPEQADFGQSVQLSTSGEEYASGAADGALDPSGNAIVSWDENTGGTIHCDCQPFAVYTAYRPKAQGSFNSGQTLATYSTGSSAAAPQAAFDSSGNAFVAYGGADYNGGTQPFSVAYEPAGGTFAIPVQVGSGKLSALRFGVDSQGRQTLMWDLTDSSGDVILQTASRDGTTGPFTAPVSQTPVGTNIDGTEPALSVSAGGQTAAIWQVYDGQEDIAQAAFGAQPPPPAPPGSPTTTTTAAPPAAQPPPPPPPVPTKITAAAPFQKGKSIVLTASVPVGATSITWDFGGSGPKPTGTVIGGLLQNSVRLHPDGRGLTAKVTVSGPFGSQTYSRTFVLPGPATDTASETVAQALQRAAADPVYGVGDASTLLGKTVCGALTVYSGQQQTSGCMRPINVVADIPNRELSAIQTVARSLGLDPSDPALMNAAVQQVDGYVGVGQVMLNGRWPVNPSAGASLVNFPGIGSLTSSGASLNVGGLNLGGLSGGFSLNIDPNKFDIPLGSLPKPQLPDIGGFPLSGDWNIDLLGGGDATIDTDLQFPSWLNLGGVPLHVPVRFKATPGGLVLDALNIGPINANLGALSVTGLKLTYDRPSDTWTGSGKVCLLTGVCLDMTPPNGEVKIVNGDLNYAGATLDFPTPGIPLFAGVNLTSIGFGLGLDPTRLKANAGISVLDLVQLNGTLVAGFPTADHPFVLNRDEVGSDFPASLYGVPFHEPTIGASADVGVNLPVVGNVTLGHGYLLYEVPDYIALGGGVDYKFLSVIDIGGSIDGAANFSDGTLNLHAEAHACLLVVGKLCADAVVNISRGPNSAGGVGGCVDVAGLHVGGGIVWKHPFDPIVWPFDGCKWSRFKVDVRPSIAAASQRTIVVRRGQPNPALKIFGNGAAPLVHVSGPGGQSLDSTTSGFDHSPGGQIRILRYEGIREDFTVVGLENARPGTYTVSAMPGSAPFATVASATDPPDAKVTAHVGGSGERRTLTYDVRNRPGQTVTFWDSSRGGAAHPIGHVTGGSGTLHFTAAPGDKRRTIYAQFTLAGMSAERINVASYQPPAATLATPGHLRVTRAKTRVTVSWTPVADAAGYEVTLTDRLTGYQRFARIRPHRLVLTHVPLTAGGTVAVRAIDPRYNRTSRVTSASIKRVAMPTSRFRKLGHCTMRKHKLSCTGGPAVKKKPVKKKPAKHKPVKKKR